MDAECIFPSHQLDNPFPILGLLGGIFHFYSNFEEASSGEPDQTPRFVAYDSVFNVCRRPTKRTLDSYRLIAFLMSCDCWCSVALSCRVVG